MANRPASAHLARLTVVRRSEPQSRCSAIGTNNCPLTPNITQSDVDVDGRGDACDGCPTVFARWEADFDRDGVSDACDGCVFLADSEQADGDSDGTGDVCDSDSSDDTVGVPTGDIELSLVHDGGTATTTVDWTAEPLASSYEVYRGDLTEIRAGHYGNCRNSSDSITTDTTIDDGDTPAVGACTATWSSGSGRPATAVGPARAHGGESET